MHLINDKSGSRLVYPNEKPMDLINEIQRVIVKVNDLLQHKDEAEYLVDLLPQEVIEHFGRDRVVGEARIVLKDSVSQEQSEKCTRIWREFDERYFSGWLLSHHKVEVRHVIHHEPICGWSEGKSVIHIPASSEPVLVERMLEGMIQSMVGRACWQCYRKESNRVHVAGAPMSAEANQRHLSAEEFIAKATREPNGVQKEWLKHQGDLPIDIEAKPAKADSVPQEQETTSAPRCGSEHKAGK